MLDFRDLKRHALERHLRRSIQGEVRFDLPSRRLYSTDASIYQIEPLGVVIPRTVEDVRTIIQIAAEHHTPIVPRGGGTSLSGQSIGAGMVVDCSKYLNQIVEVDPAARIARVQPGVILDQLNRAAAPRGLRFGPDVATANRANLGGMIGNNSAGARSIVYGKVLDHVRRLRVVLADGSPATFETLPEPAWRQKAAGNNLESQIYRAVQHIAHSHEAEIHRRFPRILRRVSGYNLDVLSPSFPRPKPEESASAASPHNLASLIVGSEGTLAFVTEAELALVAEAPYRGLLVPHFDSLAAAMEALAPCLEMKPSAIELIDEMILNLARENLALKQQMAAIHGRPAALFMVEFSGDDQLEVLDRVEKLAKRLRGVSGITALVRATDPAVRDPLWNLRSSGMPLLLGVRGDRKPATFIEDTAVPPERLPEFVARFRDVLRRHDTDGSFYGHASVGCLHIRPVLNLKDAGDVARMRLITEEVTDLVLNFGGALSGEHGDGLARSEWNRKMYGDQIYQAFRAIKHVFDPANLFNPGKIVDAPAMTENLRFGPDYHTRPPETLFDYSRQEGFAGAVEMCNGAGVCRKMQGGAMCPSFRATQDEKDSTRGRANALRLALTSARPLNDLRSQWVYDVLDLCLMCKACKAECPSNVDMAKLKAEFLHQYYQRRPRPLGHALLANIAAANRLGSAVAPAANWLGTQKFARWLMESLGGIDRRRSLPLFHSHHLRRWFSWHRPALNAGRAGKVLLLDDCFTTFNEPEIGCTAVWVLERAGYAVELAGLTCCARPLISKGFLPEARRLIAKQATRLRKRLDGGTPILGLEPSCILTLADEWPELVPNSDTRLIARAARLADDWLAEQVGAGKCSFPLAAKPSHCLVHGHCHQKTLVGLQGTLAVLRMIPEMQVKALDTGCCGMAGSFGYEKEHYDLSVAIARLALLPELEKQPDAMVVAPGTSCRHQIKDLTGRKALHPLEVLAGQLTWEGEAPAEPLSGAVRRELRSAPTPRQPFP